MKNEREKEKINGEKDEDTRCSPNTLELSIRQIANRKLVENRYESWLFYRL